MRHYLCSVQDYFRTLADTVRSFFHHPQTKLLRMIGALALIIIPTGLTSWEYYAFATAAQHALDQKVPSQTVLTPPLIYTESETQPQHESSRSSISVGGTSTNTQSTTKLNVNGQDIPVPANGVVHKEIATDNATTTVDISSTSRSSDSSHAKVSMQLNVHSHTVARGGP